MDSKAARTDAELIAYLREFNGVSAYGDDPITPVYRSRRQEIARALEARNAEVAEMKRIIKWLSERGVSPQGGICTRIRLIDYLPASVEKEAIEKIVGEP